MSVDAANAAGERLAGATPAGDSGAGVEDASQPATSVAPDTAA
jgi:hypothetical protein